MKNKFKLILEIVWLAIAVIAFVLILHAIWSKNTKDITVLIVISAVSLGMYFFRRQLRKKNKDNE